MTRRRIDALLAERGLFSSREQARAAILAGNVKVDGHPVNKAGAMVEEDVAVEVAARPRYVSRGGDKLEGALRAFEIDVTAMRAIDVGASTGGFTDCLLQHGAQSVVALDVGYGQLAWSLRSDERVTVVERTNIRHVAPQEFGAPFDLVVCDVSFISLRVVLPHLRALLGDEKGDILALVKPQFEAGKGRIGKKGVVRDEAVHVEVLASAVAATEAEGLVIRGLSFSPIKGPEGNIEFWLWASLTGEATAVSSEEIVSAAHAALGGSSGASSAGTQYR